MAAIAAPASSISTPVPTPNRGRHLSQIHQKCAFSCGLWTMQTISACSMLEEESPMKGRAHGAQGRSRLSAQIGIVGAVRVFPRVWKCRIWSRRNVRGCNGVSLEAEGGLMEGDVVEYPLAAAAAVGKEGVHERRTGVGVIVDLSKDSEAVFCQIEPLCQEDPGSNEWIQDEFQLEITVPVGQVRVLQAWYSQRMVPDRISNPHGEHAEDLWIIE